LRHVQVSQKQVPSIVVEQGISLREAALQQAPQIPYTTGHSEWPLRPHAHPKGHGGMEHLVERMPTRSRRDLTCPPGLGAIKAAPIGVKPIDVVHVCIRHRPRIRVRTGSSCTRSETRLSHARKVGEGRRTVGGHGTAPPPQTGWQTSRLPPAQWEGNGLSSHRSSAYATRYPCYQVTYAISRRP
jgi:hypothetical protein